MSPSPQSSQASSRTLGLIILGLFILAGIVMGFLSPELKFDNSHPFIMTEEGSQYVFLNNRLHPVTNAASARLILGEPVTLKSVSSHSLSSTAKGALIGIPSAPSSLTPRKDAIPAWTVCSEFKEQSVNELPKKPVTLTTAAAGKDSLDTANSLLNDATAMLVKTNDRARAYYLLYKDHRTLIDTEDHSSQTNLGLSQSDFSNALPVSTEFVNSVPEQPILTLPFIADKGKASSKVPTRAIGDVLVTDEVDTRAHYVVYGDGIQKVSPFVAQLFLSDSSKPRVEANPDDISKLPKVSPYNFQNYPTQKPKFVLAKSVCSSWSKEDKASNPQVKLYVRDTTPLTKSARESRGQLISTPNRTTFRADYTWTKPGEGWLAQVSSTIHDSHNANQILWIDDNGIRYFIGGKTPQEYSDNLHALGVGDIVPVPIPWSVAQLYGEGPTLSKDAALVIHENIPVDNTQSVMPSDTGNRKAD